MNIDRLIFGLIVAITAILGCLCWLQHKQIQTQEEEIDELTNQLCMNELAEMTGKNVIDFRSKE